METKRVLSACLPAILIALTGLWGCQDAATNDTARKVESAIPGSPDGSAGNEKDVITIENEGYNSDRKGPVKFTHRKHALEYKILCWECHHEYDEGKNLWSPWNATDACAECHMPSEDMDNIMNLQKAYHVNCRNCHKALWEREEKTGPYRKCYGCHEKTT